MFCSKSASVVDVYDTTEGRTTKGYTGVTVAPISMCVAADLEVVCFKGGRVAIDAEQLLAGHQQGRLSCKMYHELSQDTSSLAKYFINQRDFLLFLKWVYTGRKSCINPTVEKVALTLGCLSDDMFEDVPASPQKPDDANSDDYIWRETVYPSLKEEHIWSQTIHGWYRASKAVLTDQTTTSF